VPPCTPLILGSVTYARKTALFVEYYGNFCQMSFIMLGHRHQTYEPDTTTTPLPLGIVVGIKDLTS